MQVSYDSRVHGHGKPHIVGKHSGAPRIWRVRVWAEGLDHIPLFVPKSKVQISDLAGLIDNYLREHGVAKEAHIRWIATAR